MTSTSDMTSEEYEILAKNIHQALLAAEGYTTIDIQHDVKVVGRSGQEHQIDVYWKFSIAGAVYQTAIECKKYNRPISVGRVRDFSAALDDIGNINGIMVTTAGYQSGAEIFASFRKIRLVEIRSPTDTDLSGLILTIVVQIVASMRNVVSRNIQLSDAWRQKNSDKFKDENYTVSGMNNEIGLYSADGIMVRSWWDIENELPVCDSDGNALPRDVVLAYDVDVAGLHLLWPIVGLVPLKAVTLDYTINDIRRESRIESDLSNSYLMRDVQTDEKTFFVSKDGDIAIKPSPQY